MSKLVRNVLIAAAVAVGLVLVAEVIARFAMPGDPYGEASVAFANQVEGFEPTARISLTGQGLRPASWREREGEPRVLCLGTDNTFSLLQGDEGEWWARLGEDLRQGGGKARTVAVGLPGRTLVDLAAWAEDFDEWEKFKAVVVLAGINEVRSRHAKSNLEERGQNLYPTVAGFKRSLLKNSGLVRNLRNSRGHLQGAIQGVYGPLTEANAVKGLIDDGRKLTYEVAMNPQNRVPFLLVEQYGNDRAGVEQSLVRQARAGVARLAEVCKKHNVPLLVVFEPTLEDQLLTPTEANAKISLERISDRQVVVLDRAWVDHEFGLIAEGMRQQAQESSCSFINLRGVVPADLTHFAHELQLTDAGATAVAAALAEPVKQLLAGEAVTAPAPK